jgi:hypothetical protein
LPLPPAHAHTSTDRAALVRALSSVSEVSRRVAAQSFLEGLSSDELRYIADFVGASCLDPDLKPGQTRALIASCIERYQQMSRPSSGCCHKMILLLEFLSINTLRTGSFRALGGVA